MIVSMDTPLFELVEGEGDKEKVTPLFSVMDILESIISIGKRGVEITRFKGLGEMDAKDLFKTTMGPGTARAAPRHPERRQRRQGR